MKGMLFLDPIFTHFIGYGNDKRGAGEAVKKANNVTEDNITSLEGQYRSPTQPRYHLKRIKNIYLRRKRMEK